MNTSSCDGRNFFAYVSLKLAAVPLLALALPIGAAAQQPAAQNRPATPPPTVSGAIRNFYNGVKNNTMRAGDKMPEEFFGLRPGQQEEVRTFGQQLAHVARFSYLWCSEARGEKNPNEGTDLEKTLKTKEEIAKALKASYDYCDPAYAALNDANMGETITITQESGRVVQQTRAGLLMLNVVHIEEVYGSLVTTLRMKNIVPPSSEPRPQQAAQPLQERNLQ